MSVILCQELGGRLRLLWKRLKDGVGGMKADSWEQDTLLTENVPLC